MYITIDEDGFVLLHSSLTDQEKVDFVASNCTVLVVRPEQVTTQFHIYNILEDGTEEELRAKT